MSRRCQQVCAVEDAAPKPRALRWATVLFTALILVIATVGSISLGPGNALAAQVSCGDTIIANTTLHADLVNCPGNGLVIGADRITLDLNGHTIAGSLNGAAGIDNSAGHDGVTIKNGAVRNFTNGVLLLEHATGDRVQRLTLVSDNSTGAADNGVLIFDSDHNHVEHNSVTGSFNGIFLGNTTDSAVDRNRVSGVNNAILLFDADRNAVKRNTLADLLDTGVGIFGGADNVIGENSASDGEAGVSVEGDRNAVAGNRLFKNGDDLRVSGDGNAVVGNRVRDALGCEDNGCGFGITVEAGTGNLISRNLVSRTLRDGT